MKQGLSPFSRLLLVAVLVTLYRAWLPFHLGLDPYVDEAYYWGWSRELAWGYYSKPPLIALLIRLSNELFGNNLLALRMPSLLLYPATALVLQRLGARLHNEQTGFWAGLAFLSLPLVSALGMFVSTDAPLLFCWTLGMLLLWDALQTGKLWQWLLLGVIVGCGLMAKYTMAAFIGSAFLVLLALPEGRQALRKPGPWLALLLAFLILAPNLWWNAQLNFPTFTHTAEITRLEKRTWSPHQLLEFVATQWGSMGPLLGVLFIMALKHGRTLWQTRQGRLLLLFALPLLLLVCAQALTGRANGNWAAPAFIGALLLAVGCAWPGPSRRLILIALGLNFLVMLGAYHWSDMLRIAGVPASAHNDPFKRTRGWAALTAGLKPYLDAHPNAVVIAEERDILAEVAYFLQPAELASWHPRAHVMDQYQLTTNLSRDLGRDMLLLTRDDDSGQRPHFDASERLGEVNIAVHPDFHRRLRVYLLRNFHGYQ